MRVHTLIVVLGLAVLAAGCGKSARTYSDGSSGTGKGKSKGPRVAERMMPANAEALKESIAGYLARPENNVRDAMFFAISEPIKVKQAGGTAQAYWVQYGGTNSYGDAYARQHELFLLKEGNVIMWCRTTDEIRDKLGTRWVDEHLPPSWPELMPADVTKETKE